MRRVLRIQSLQLAPCVDRTAAMQHLVNSMCSALSVFFYVGTLTLKLPQGVMPLSLK